MFLRHAQDGHHFTVTRPYGGQIGFVTYRINEEGVDYLRRRSIVVEDDIPLDALKYLLDRGLAFTSGSGVDGQGDQALLENLVKRVAPELKAHTLPLRLRTKGNECSLECWIPPIRQKSISHDRAYLRREWAGIDGERIPLSDLLAGIVGYWQPVLPHESDYELDFRTAALAAFSPEEWKQESPGLLSTGTLFHSEEEGGTRLLPSQGVLPEKAYSLVATSTQQIPSNVLVSQWRQLNSWKVADLVMPEEIDDQCEEWLHGLGQFVESEPLVVRFMAPPALRFVGDILPVTPPAPAYLVGIQGIRTNATEVTVEVRSNEETLDQFTCPPSDPLWLKLGHLDRGRYVLLAVAGRQAKSYLFQVEASEQPSAPRPIAASFKVLGEELKLDGTWESTDRNVLDLESLAFKDNNFEVLSIKPTNIPITLEYTSPTKVLSNDFSDTASLLDGSQHAPISNLSRLRFDAGNYGAITVTSQPPVQKRSRHLPSDIQAKIKWLTATLLHTNQNKTQQTTALQPQPTMAWCLSTLEQSQDPEVLHLRSALLQRSSSTFARRYWPHLATICEAVGVG